MAIKISELPAGTPNAGALIPGVVGGVTQSFAFSTPMAGLWGAADFATMRAMLGAGTSNAAPATTISPVAAGAGVVGTSLLYARADHVHPAQAVPAASTTNPANLAAAAAVGVGTTFARADHVHAIPGASVGTTRGTVLIQTALADLAGAATLPEVVTAFNSLLAKLRAADVIAT